MNYHDLCEKAISFIMMDKLDHAMNLLIKYEKNHQTIALSARLENLKNITIVGTISNEEKSTERNKIRDSLLSYCQDLKNRTEYHKNGALDVESTDIEDNTNVITDTRTLEIEIKINRDFNTYSAEDQEKLLSAIKNILEIKGDVNIKQMREGSVILTLELTPDQCEKLHWAIKSGKLDEFDVVDSEIVKNKPDRYIHDFDFPFIDLTDSIPDSVKIVASNLSINAKFHDFIHPIESLNTYFPILIIDLSTNTIQTDIQDDIDQIPLNSTILFLPLEDVVRPFQTTVLFGMGINKSMEGLNVAFRGFEIYSDLTLPIHLLADKYKGHIGKTFFFKVVKVDDNIKNAVVNHKAIIEDMWSKRREQVLENIFKGQILQEGVVIKINNFGAVIKLGDFYGFLHIDDISWVHISHPSEVLHINQIINVVVLDIDKDKKFISLSLKHLTPRP